MSGRIELKVGGRIFDAWKAARIRRGLNTFAASFDLTVSRQHEASARHHTALGAPCRIVVEGVPVVTGYLDEISPTYSANSHEITLTGRSKTADLIDCAAIFATGQITGGDIAAIAREILAPFAIELDYLPTGKGHVKLPPAGGAGQKIAFQLQQGETAAHALQRLCALHALLWRDDAEGRLRIFRPENAPPVGRLVHRLNGGAQNNILAGTCRYSWQDRFSRYLVKSQQAGSDFMEGEEFTSVEGEAEDNEITRYRPLVLLPESSIDSETAATRAEWEKSTRIGKSLTLTYTVQGWRNERGELWEPGAFVMVDDEFAHAQGKLIISETEFAISNEGGTTTTLKLSPLEAFIPSSAAQPIKTFKAWQELKYGV